MANLNTFSFPASVRDDTLFYGGDNTLSGAAANVKISGAQLKAYIGAITGAVSSVVGATGVVTAAQIALALNLTAPATAAFGTAAGQVADGGVTTAGISAASQAAAAAQTLANTANTLAGTANTAAANAQATANAANTLAAAAVPSSAVGATVAGLSGGKVPLSQLPASVIGSNHYISTWNASTNTPTIVSSTAPPDGLTGGYYIVATAGTTTINGVSTWNVGDWIIYDGSKWDKLDGQANPVASVVGAQGVVTAAQIATALGLTAPATAPFGVLAGQVADGAALASATALATAALSRAGGTMTGLLVLSGDPTALLGAVTKQYADAIGTIASAALSRAGGTMTGALVLNADPTVTLGAATKGYVDAATSGGGTTTPITATRTAQLSTPRTVTAAKFLGATDLDLERLYGSYFDFLNANNPGGGITLNSGSHDDAPQISAAIVDASSNFLRGVRSPVLLPAGVAKIVSAITPFTVGVPGVVRGKGQSLSVFDVDPSYSSALFTIDNCVNGPWRQMPTGPVDYTTFAGGAEFTDFCINGNRTFTGTARPWMFLCLDNQKHLIIRNVEGNNFPGGFLKIGVAGAQNNLGAGPSECRIQAFKFLNCGDPNGFMIDLDAINSDGINQLSLDDGRIFRPAGGALRISCHTNTSNRQVSLDGQCYEQSGPGFPLAQIGTWDQYSGAAGIVGSRNTFLNPSPGSGCLVAIGIPGQFVGGNTKNIDLHFNDFTSAGNNSPLFVALGGGGYYALTINNFTLTKASKITAASVVVTQTFNATFAGNLMTLTGNVTASGSGVVNLFPQSKLTGPTGSNLSIHQLMSGTDGTTGATYLTSYKGPSVGILRSSRASNIVTVNTSGPHGLSVGNSVSIQLVPDSSFQGTFTVASVTGSTSFTYSNAGSNVNQVAGGIVCTISAPIACTCAYGDMSVSAIDGSAGASMVAHYDAIQQFGTGQTPSAQTLVMAQISGTANGVGRYAIRPAQAFTSDTFNCLPYAMVFGAGVVGPNVIDCQGNESLLLANPIFIDESITDPTIIQFPVRSNGTPQTYSPSTGLTIYDNYIGGWNANTNVPALASGVAPSGGVQGAYRVVGVAGATTIDGNSVWNAGDRICWNAAAGVWQKVAGANTAPLSGGVVPDAYLPVTATASDHYLGPWNANGNTPNITSGTAPSDGRVGGYRVVGVAGTTTVDGNSSWLVGDKIAWNGTTWNKFCGPNTAQLVGGTVPLSQLPATVIGSNHYLGVWNANTNTPTLVSGTSPDGLTGGYRVVGVAGTTSIDGNAIWGVGDWIIFDGTRWDKLDGQANPVSSVVGLTGAVTSAQIASALGGIGTAASKAASASAQATLASVGTGAITIGHAAVFQDTAGTIGDGGLPATAGAAVTSFLPTLAPSTLGDWTVAYSVQSSRYIRSVDAGGQAWCDYKFTMTFVPTFTTASGPVTWTLPLASANDGLYGNLDVNQPWTAISFGSAGTEAMWSITPNQAKMAMIFFKAAAAFQAINTTAFTSGTTYTFSGSGRYACV